jgi:hypothetical protein
MDLQSLRHRGRFVLAPAGDSCDPYRRHQILLQRGQYRVGADLDFRVATAIVTAGESDDSDKENGETW